MKFPKGFLIDNLDEDPIEEKIVDKGRWTITYRRIFMFENELYETFYRVGATESQDERPYEYETHEIECSKVIAVPITQIVYRAVE